MRNRTPKVRSYFRKTYLAVIRNSVGSRIFKDFYGSIDGEERNLTEKGILSCAYFVSGILRLFDLAEEVHLTVRGTITDLEKSGWRKINKPKIGCIIVWGDQKTDGNTHAHIGFYVGNDKAISNSSSKRQVSLHDLTFGGTREITGFYWNKKINQNFFQK